MFSKVIMVGRMTADPEIKTTPNGTSVCTFSVACDRRFKDKGGNKKADFIPCVAWRHDAEFVGRFFQKGAPIGIEGSLQTRSYTNKDGDKRTAYEVIVDRAFFVGSKEKTSVEVENPAQGEFDDSADFPF